jgi:hypothetical protein
MRFITLQIQDRLGKSLTLPCRNYHWALELTDDNDTTHEEQQIPQGIVNLVIQTLKRDAQSYRCFLR